MSSTFDTLRWVSSSDSCCSRLFVFHFSQKSQAYLYHLNERHVAKFCPDWKKTSGHLSSFACPRPFMKSASVFLKRVSNSGAYILVYLQGDFLTPHSALNQPDSLKRTRSPFSISSHSAHEQHRQRNNATLDTFVRIRRVCRHMHTESSRLCVYACKKSLCM